MTQLADRAQRWANRLGEILGWAASEIGTLLPASLQTVGVRRRARLVSLGREGRAVSQTRVVQFLSGGWRERAAEDAAAPGALGVVTLYPDRVYRRQLVLGPAAARQVDAALMHRLPELCPVPLEEAVHAWRVLAEQSASGLAIELAIARRSVVAAALEQTASEAALVAAAFDESGPVLVLGRVGGARLGQGWAAAALVVLALGFGAWAAGVRADRDIAALETERAVLLDAARDLRVETGSAEALAPLIERQLVYPTLAEVLVAAETALTGLAEQAAPSGLIVNQRRLTLPDANDPETPLVELRIEAIP